MNSHFKAFKGRIINFLSQEKVEYFPNGVIIVNRESGKIVEYGEWNKIKRKYQNIIDIFDFKDDLLMPGFIDTHVHLSHFGADIEERDLKKWLKLIYKYEKNIKDAEYAEVLAEEFFDFILSNGVTTSAIHASYFKEGTEKAFEVAKRRGVKAIIGMTIVDNDKNLLQELIKDPNEALEESKELFNRWHRPEEGLFYALTPRSGWSCTEDFLGRVGKLRKDLDCYIQTHLAETENSKHDTELFFRTDILSHKSILGHGLYVNDDDFYKLKKTGSSISHNPSSDNITMANRNKVINLYEYKKHDIPVGLGVDEPWHFPPFKVIKDAKKINKDILYITLFYLYTLGGARVLGLENITGNFAQGKDADFIVIDISKLHKLANLQNKRMEEYIENEERLLGLIVEFGQRRLIKKVFIKGKQVHGNVEVRKGDFYKETIEFISSVTAENRVRYNKAIRHFNRSLISEIINTTIEHLVRGGHENTKFSSIVSLLSERVVWLAYVFHSREFEKLRFINVFEFVPPVTLHEYASIRNMKENHRFLFGEFANGASFEGIYEKWDKEGKLIPIFDLFLEPPTPMDVDREAFAWYSSHVVFHREIWDNKSRDHWIYIGDLVSVELIDSYRRQIRTIICDDSIASDDLRRKCIEERIEKIIEYHAPHSKERIHEILEQISIILQKPSLASSNENPDNSYKKLFATILLFLLHDQRWSCYYYFPAQVLPWFTIGSCAIASKEPLPHEFEILWQHATNVLFSQLNALQMAKVERERGVLEGWKRLASNVGHNVKNLLSGFYKETINGMKLGEYVVKKYHSGEKKDYGELIATEKVSTGLEVVYNSLIWLKLAGKGISNEEPRQYNLIKEILIIPFLTVYTSFFMRGPQEEIGKLKKMCNDEILVPPIFTIKNRNSTEMPLLYFPNIMLDASITTMLGEANVSKLLDHYRDVVKNVKILSSIEEIDSILTDDIRAEFTEGFESVFYELYYNAIFRGILNAPQDTCPYNIELTLQDESDGFVIEISNPCKVIDLKAKERSGSLGLCEFFKKFDKAVIENVNYRIDFNDPFTNSELYRDDKWVSRITFRSDQNGEKNKGAHS